MAKIQVIDTEDRTRVPFLRGILTRSLQDSGLSFEAAYSLASTIRQELGSIPEVTSRQLRDLVLRHIMDEYGPKVLERYRAPRPSETIIQVEHPDGQITPFSGIQHRRCLETIGLTREEATDVMMRLRTHLVDKRTTSVTSQHIAHLTYRCLRLSAELGPPVARRYMIWVHFVRSGRPLVILIGGTAGCGKSTIATSLADRLDIVRTQSTDMLREVMRTMLPQRLLPVLHRSSFNAWEAMAVHDTEAAKDPETRLADGYRSQADLLTVAIEAVLQRAHRERVSMIVEGVHVQPMVISDLPRSEDALIVPIMLAVLKRKRLQKRIAGRGTTAPQRRAERYLENFDNIWSLQSYLLSEADRYNIPIIDNDMRGKVIREIMRVTIEKLAQDFSATPKEVFG